MFLLGLLVGYGSIALGVYILYKKKVKKKGVKK